MKIANLTRVISKFYKIRQRILDGKSDANINLEDLRNLLLNLGLAERIKGSHHSYRKEEIIETELAARRQ